MVDKGLRIAERGRPLGARWQVWIQFRLVPFLAFLIHRTLRTTLRVKWEGFEAVQDLVARDQRIIISFWHRRLVMMILAYPFKRTNAEGEARGVVFLSSDSKDGERSAATWRWYGVQAVRGTAGRSGAQALVKMIQAVKQGWDLAITVDGPRGPRQEVKPGVLAVSRKTGAWVVPVCVAYKHVWKLKTWDEMLVPMPFTSVVVRYGEPFRALITSDEEADRSRLETLLNDLERRAEDQKHA